MCGTIPDVMVLSAEWRHFNNNVTYFFLILKRFYSICAITVSNFKLCNLIIAYLRNLFLKKINVIFLSKGTYMTLAQSINQGHIL